MLHNVSNWYLPLNLRTETLEFNSCVIFGQFAKVNRTYQLDDGPLVTILCILCRFIAFFLSLPRFPSPHQTLVSPSPLLPGRMNRRTRPTWVPWRPPPSTPPPPSPPAEARACLPSVTCLDDCQVDPLLYLLKSPQMIQIIHVLKR